MEKLIKLTENQLKIIIENTILKETGEWADDEEGLAEKQYLRDLIKPIEDKIDFFELIDIVGFDKYSGPYALVKILDKEYKIWTSTEDLLWIEDFPIDNTSKEGLNPGFLGTPQEIIDKLYVGFQLPPIKENNIIKLKESEFKNIINNVLLKEQDDDYNNISEDPKAIALANFLIHDEEIEVGLTHIIPSEYDHYGLSMYKVKDREYAVGTDEEADDAYEQDQRDFIDDNGLEGFNQDFIMNYIDKEWFEGALREHLEYYIEDIKYESSRNDENRLEREMAEWGVDNEEDFLEKIIDDAGDPVEDYKSNYGKEQFNKVVKQNNLINVDELIEGIKNSDGRGSSLSGYDGVENEYGDYYIYRTN